MLPRLAAGDSPATRPLISLIVPVWNDDELVVDLVSGLQVASELAEWVVAAVRPGQPLCELHRRGIVQLISCDKPSRGRQMNAGAAKARGSLLCFHHADSELRPEHLNALEKIARNDAIVGGAFHRRFDDRRASNCLTVRSLASSTLASILTHCIDGIIADFGDRQIATLASIHYRGRFATNNYL